MSSFPRSSWIRSFAIGVLAGMSFSLSCATATAQDKNADVTIVADHVRSQGFTCNNPSSVERIEAESMPNEPVYVLKCEGVSYRVRLVPDQAAEVSEIK